MFWVVVALLYFVLAAVAPSILGLFVNRARPDFRALSLSLRAVFVIIALICLAATSYVHVESDEIAVLNKIYGTTSLPGEHIIATNGEKGPQAEILTPGWHPWFLVNVIYHVENKKVVSIPSGKYGFLNAKDGAPLRPDQFLADAFSPGHELDLLDAEYFLIHGGQRGPQTTIPTPGNYRLNTYLWDLSIYDAVDIAEGFVGVVTSKTCCSIPPRRTTNGFASGSVRIRGRPVRARLFTWCARLARSPWRPPQRVATSSQGSVRSVRNAASAMSRSGEAPGTRSCSACLKASPTSRMTMRSTPAAEPWKCSIRK
jgi:hypothetical protein